MPRRSAPPIDDDHGWLITPRALTSVATVVGLIYTLHTPVRYVLEIGAAVDALNARVAALESERDRPTRDNAVAERVASPPCPGFAPGPAPPASRVRGRRLVLGAATDRARR